MTTSGRRVMATLGALLAGIGFAIVVHSPHASDGNGAIIPGTAILGLGAVLLANAFIRD